MPTLKLSTATATDLVLILRERHAKLKYESAHAPDPAIREIACLQLVRTSRLIAELDDAMAHP